MLTKFSTFDTQDYCIMILVLNMLTNWCKTPEDGNCVKTCRIKLIVEYIIQNCAFIDADRDCKH